MTQELLIACFVALFTKHFIFDFLLQRPFQYLNKGTYGHPGGVLHSSLQAAGTFIVLIFFLDVRIVLAVALIDGVIHYHIDWAKVKINRHFQLKPDNSEKFWWLLGFDQYLHYLTYAGLLWSVLKWC